MTSWHRFSKVVQIFIPIFHFEQASSLLPVLKCLITRNCHYIKESEEKIANVVSAQDVLAEAQESTAQPSDSAGSPPEESAFPAGSEQLPNVTFPESKEYSNFNCIPCGNDPVFHISPLLSEQDKYAIVATGGIRCLDMALEIIEKTNCVPLIFMIDNSINTKCFWEYFNQAIKESNSLDDFLDSLPDSYIDCKKWGFTFAEKGIKEKIKDINPKLFPELNIKKHLSDTSKKHQYMYEKLKKIINEKFKYVNLDWSSREAKEAFCQIKEMTDNIQLKIIMYESNIQEFLENDMQRWRYSRNTKKLSPEIRIQTKRENKKRNMFPDMVIFHQKSLKYPVAEYAVKEEVTAHI